MAIVFISPKKRKKALIHAVTGLFGFILVIVGFIIFLRTPKPIETEIAFKPQKIEINFSVLQSKQVTDFKLFEMRVKKKFDYEAITEDNQPRKGKILAVSAEKAQERLEGFDLVDIKVWESEIGRENPYAPFIETPEEENGEKEPETEE